MNGLFSILIMVVALGSSILFTISLLNNRPAWGIGAMRLTWRPWDGLAASFAVLSLILGGVMVSLLFQWVAPISMSGEEEPSVGVLLAGMGGMYAVAITVVVVMVRRRRGDWIACFDRERYPWTRWVGFGVFGYLASMVFVVLAASLSQWILGVLDIEQKRQELFGFLEDSQSFWVLSGLVFLATVAAPVVEEVYFRGIIFPAISRRFGVGVGMFASSLMFSLIHVNLSATLPLFVLALGLCLLYLYTSSLRACVLMHSLFNLVAVSAFLWGPHASG